MFQSGLKEPSPDKYGIEIKDPEAGTIKSTVTVKGVFKEKIPNDKYIWVFTVYHFNSVENYYPQGRAATNDGRWKTKAFNIGDSGDKLKLVACLVGETADKLLNYYLDAERDRNKWPPLDLAKVNDIFECDSVNVEIRSK